MASDMIHWSPLYPLLVPRAGIDTAIPDRARTGLNHWSMVEFEGVKDIWLYSDHLEALAVAQIYGERIVEGHLANPEM